MYIEQFYIIKKKNELNFQKNELFFITALCYKDLNTSEIYK